MSEQFQSQIKQPRLGCNHTAHGESTDQLLQLKASKKIVEEEKNEENPVEGENSSEASKAPASKKLAAGQS